MNTKNDAATGVTIVSFQVTLENLTTGRRIVSSEFGRSIGPPDIEACMKSIRADWYDWIETYELNYSVVSVTPLGMAVEF